jgi:hypothetical protein
MIHGNTTMEITYESVLEAVQEWLDGHMANNVKLKIAKWSSTASAVYGTQPGIKVEFTQLDPSADKPQGKSE